MSGDNDPVPAQRPRLQLKFGPAHGSQFRPPAQHSAAADELPTRSTFDKPPPPSKVLNIYPNSYTGTSKAPHFHPLDYAPFDAPASPHVFSIATSFPSPTLGYVPVLSPSSSRYNDDETSWPWNWDDPAKDAVLPPAPSPNPSSLSSPDRDSTQSFRGLWKEKLESIPEGIIAGFTEQLSPSRGMISMTGASIALRRANGAHASGPGHGAQEGGKDDLFDDMIRLIETKRRVDLPYVNSFGKGVSRYPLKVLIF